jgi:hypothetical protein
VRSHASFRNNSKQFETIRNNSKQFETHLPPQQVRQRGAQPRVVCGAAGGVHGGLHVAPQHYVVAVQLGEDAVDGEGGRPVVLAEPARRRGLLM